MLRADRVIVDENGLLSEAADAADVFPRSSKPHMKSRRSRSVRACTHPGFDESVSKILAAARVRRLLYHARVWQTRGDSVRRADPEVCITGRLDSYPPTGGYGACGNP